MDYVMWIIIGGLFVLVFVLPMFTRKKQQNQVNDMLNNLAVGDKVKTVGGIVGTVVHIDVISPVDKEFILETGEEIKSHIRFDINAIYQVIKKNAPQGEPYADNTAGIDANNAEVFETEQTDNLADDAEPVADNKPRSNRPPRY